MTISIHGASVAHVPLRAPQVAQPPTVDAQPVHVGTLHTLAELTDAMPGERLPTAADIVLPGQVLLRDPVPEHGPRALLSFGKDDHVILSVHDAETGKSALAHVERSDQIDRALACIVEHLEAGSPPARLTAALFGGVWTTSPDDIGVEVRDGLVRRGITPTWYQWSFPMGREDHHGVVLDRSNGQVTVFEHAAELADALYASLSDDEVWSDFERSEADEGYASLSDDATWSDYEDRTRGSTWLHAV